MEIRPSFLIPAMAKAMADTVLPAVDPSNKLAVEQARIVIGMLHLMASRLPFEFRYDREELAQFLELARKLGEITRGGKSTDGAMRELDDCVRAGADVLDRARADPQELVRAARDLRARIGTLVSSVGEDGDAGASAAVRRAVLDASVAQNERERAWVLPQGWEPDPKSLRPLEAVLPGPRKA